MSVQSVARLLLRLAPLLASSALGALMGQAPLRAHLSPNCQRNGVAAACAIPPGESGPERSVVTVMFADHSAWRLEKSNAAAPTTTP